MAITEKEIQDRKIKEEIFNTKNENLKKLEQLFPEVVKDGQVDFVALKEELGEFEEVGNEKYGLNWTGKQEAKKVAQEDVINRTLKYVPEESKNTDTTENLYIEGDNLEALKLLRQNYYNSIKMIYIDPPYNTGNDFIYNDDYSMNSKESDIQEGNTSELDERYTVNQKSSNKFHAKWLDMMYPRLKVAKDLLVENGAIFISIDDNELDNLIKVCNEIFGEANYVGVTVRKTKSMTNDIRCGYNTQHEYVVIYAKNINKLILRGEEKDFSNYNNPDNDPLGDWCIGDPSAKSGGKGTYFKIKNPITGSVDLPPKGRYWAFSKSTLDEYIKKGKIKFKQVVKENQRGFIFKRYKKDVANKFNPLNSLFATENNYMNQTATKELIQLLNDNYFDYPKPIKFIGNIVKSITSKDDIILDFFSGSATTAHAVNKINSMDNGSRKYIMIQLPEKVMNKHTNIDFIYKNICEVAKERIRRAGQKIIEENKDKEGIENLDIGFKVFKVGDTNLRWNNYNNINVNQISLEEGKMSDKDKIDFMPGTKDIDVVYEILLRQRDIPLSSKVAKLSEIGDRTFIFAESFVVCLEENITEDLINKLAALNPLPIKFYFRDSAFNDDIDLKDYSIRELEALVAKNTGDDNNSYTVEFI